jgi:hypothetical protein
MYRGFRHTYEGGFHYKNIYIFSPQIVKFPDKTKICQRELSTHKATTKHKANQAMFWNMKIVIMSDVFEESSIHKVKGKVVPVL